MTLIWFLLVLAVAAVCISLGIAYYCYRVAFYAPRKPLPEGAFDLPEGKEYEPFHDSMKRWIQEARTLPRETFTIQAFDGLKLSANYYEYAPGAPIELMFHGYRGSAERDLSCGIPRCFRLGRSAFIVDQRCSGDSEGHVITFGINEHKDCLAWIDFMVDHFGPDVKIILTGLSMGASTVLMAGGKDLPENVIGILADCGYHSQKDIICKAIREMGLSPKAFYPFAKLGARIFGHFDLEETSPVEALKNCKVPVLFFHGDADELVPCEMSRTSYEACASRKQLVIIPGAGHGLAYPVGKEAYLKAAREFFGPESGYAAPEA